MKTFFLNGKKNISMLLFLEKEKYYTCSLYLNQDISVVYRINVFAKRPIKMNTASILSLLAGFITYLLVLIKQD